MRLYVINPNTKEKIYIKNIASTKKELGEEVGTKLIRIEGVIYSIDQVIAEESFDPKIPMAIGGIVGLLGGFWGVAGGTAIGGLYGSKEKEEDLLKVKIFNESSL